MHTAKNIWNSAASSSWTPNKKLKGQYGGNDDEIELRHLTTAYSAHSFQMSDDKSTSSYIEDSKHKPWYRKIYEPPKSRYREGWRFGAFNGALAVSASFLLNFIATIWGSRHGFGVSTVLFQGDCERVRQMNTALHFLINVLSTVLLSSSNYCMQCLSAPTRKEVDEAHAKGRSLDIGIPSVKNLQWIDRKRAILWFLLGISSLPLHLL